MPKHKMMNDKPAVGVMGAGQKAKMMEGMQVKGKAVKRPKKRKAKNLAEHTRGLRSALRY